MSTNNLSQKDTPLNTTEVLDKLKIVYIPFNNRHIITWAALLDEKCVGNISLQLHLGNRVKFIDAWVHQDYRRMGIFRKLWDTRWEYVKEHYKGYKVFAWCKEGSLPLLLEKGFTSGEIITYVEKDLDF